MRCKVNSIQPKIKIPKAWFFAFFGLYEENYPTKARMMTKMSAASRAETGIVSTQAQKRLMVTPQRTADKRFDNPTPTI